MGNNPNDRFFASAPRFGRRAQPQDFGSGEGLRTLGEAIGTAAAVGARVVEADQNAAVARANNEATKAINNLVQRYKDGLGNVLPGDHQSYQEQYDEEADKIVESFTDGIFSESHKSKFRDGIFAHKERSRITIKGVIENNAIDTGVAILDQMEIDKSNAAALSETPDEAEQHRMDYFDAVAEAVGDSRISQTDAVKRMAGFDKKVRDAVILAGIRSNPGRTAQMLTDRNNFPDMPEHIRQQWIDKAITEYQTNLRLSITAERNARQREKARIAKVNTETAKEAIELAGQTNPDGTNALTVDWVVDNKENLSKTDFEKFLKASLSGGGFKAPQPDPEVYLSLVDMADLGDDPEIFQASLREAFLDGKINKEQFDQLDNRIKTTQFRDARDFLSNALRVGEAVENITGRALRAQAVAEFEDWVIRNPNATRVQAMSKARRIAASSARLSDTTIEKMQLRPEHLVRNDKGDIDAEATRSATTSFYMDDMKLHDLSTDERMNALLGNEDYVIQLRRIKEMEALRLKREQADAMDKAAKAGDSE